jgi:DNA-binding transcriptional regulator LsrR (DeoR family)
MQIRERSLLADVELGLATRAAWLSFVGGYTQEEIARRLGVSRVKVNRLIALAQRSGRVHVFVEGTAAECVALERTIEDRFGLAFCSVMPGLDETPLPLRALASAGALYLHRMLEDPQTSLVGIGHGRTLAALVEQLPRLPRQKLRFVSLLGSLTRHAAANPFDVIHRLAETTGADCYFMPVPFFADSVEDKRVLMAQKSLRDVFALARSAELYIVGIGEVGPRAHLRQTGMITEAEQAEVEAAGAIGEVLGQFVDPSGRVVDAEINERSIGIGIEELMGHRVIAVAGGASKLRAIAGVLSSGVITGLITDETTAGGLVELTAGAVRRPPGPLQLKAS